MWAFESITCFALQTHVSHVLISCFVKYGLPCAFDLGWIPEFFIGERGGGISYCSSGNVESWGPRRGLIHVFIGLGGGGGRRLRLPSLPPLDPIPDLTLGFRRHCIILIDQHISMLAVLPIKIKTYDFFESNLRNMKQIRLFHNIHNTSIAT